MADPLSAAPSVMTVVKLTGNLVSLTYEYLWGVGTVPNDLQKLVDELQSLGKVLAGLRNYTQPDQPPTLQEISGLNGPLSECATELKGLQLRLGPGEGLQDHSKKLIWPLKEKQTFLHISRIERHKNIFALVLQLMTDKSKLSKAMEGYAQDTDDVTHSPQSEPPAQNAQTRAAQIFKQRKHDLDWLYSEDFESSHLNTSGRRQAGTGRWLLQVPVFQKWIKGQPGFLLLWGRGISGAGKTFVSSTVIDHIQLQAQTSNIGVAYIYFDYMERDRQKPEHVLASLLKQLACQTPFSVGDKLWERLRHFWSDSTPEKLYKNLFETSKAFDRVYLIFDGLDECDQKNQRNYFLPLFHILAKDSINVFITSRLHLGDIQHSLRSAAKIDLSARNEDIKAYIEQKLNEDSRAKRLFGQGKSRDKIIAELTAYANGMFLPLHFHIKTICQQPTVRHVFKELERLRASSRGDDLLDSTYSRTIENIHKQDRSCVVMALKILTWLAKAQRTLTVDELREAVSVEAGRYELEEWDLPDTETLLDVCAGLITINENRNTVHLIHYTAREYLLKSCVLPSDADFQVAAACITYLSFNTFSQSVMWPEDRLKAHKFFGYASMYLSAHMSACELSLTTKIFLRFTENLGHIGSYMQAIERGVICRQEKVLPLHVASFVGHLLVVRLLLDKGADPSCLDKNGRTALHEAVRGNHTEIVELLLEYPTDIEAADEDGKTVLHWAARKGNKEIVKLLLENGAYILGQGKGGQAALHEAARGGHKEVVGLLLENGAYVSAREEGGRTALHVAARENYKEIVQLLLENGEDVSVQNTNCQTALHLAALASHKEIVQLLLKEGANISIKDKEGETALHQAARGGHKGITQLLLENRADVSAKTYSGVTALQRAAYWGYTDIVQIFLENGADTSIPKEDHEEALSIAAEQGHKEVVQLLLENGADISVQGNTSLLRAACGGHEEIIQLLLDNGADISIQGVYGGGALFEAVRRGHKGAVKLLLENGVDISVRHRSRQTILHEAAYQGDKEIVQLLLDNGADISAQDENGQTALHKAADSTHKVPKRLIHETSYQWEYADIEEVIQLLLENGADISAQDGRGQTALHLAVKLGRKEVVQLLLANGADVSIQDKDSRTAFYQAAVWGCKEAVQLLLDIGAHISVRNQTLQTAFFLAAERGHHEVVRLLLENGADISESDENGQTAFFLAAGGGHHEVVQLLLESGADISETNGDGLSAFVLAVGKGHHEVVQLLLESGADISETNGDGQSAFFLAVENGHHEVVRLLLENGADISETNADGQTALFLAADAGDRNIFQLLLDNGADTSVRDRHGHIAFINDEEYEEEYNNDHLYSWEYFAHGW